MSMYKTVCELDSITYGQAFLKIFILFFYVLVGITTIVTILLTFGGMLGIMLSETTQEVLKASVLYAGLFISFIILSEIIMKFFLYKNIEVREAID